MRGSVALLFALFMLGMLLAERAIFGNSEPVGVVTLVFVAVVVSVFAFGTFESYFGSC